MFIENPFFMNLFHYKFQVVTQNLGFQRVRHGRAMGQKLCNHTELVLYSTYSTHAGLLTKHEAKGWLNVGVVLPFCMCMDQDTVEVHNDAEK